MNKTQYSYIIGIDEAGRGPLAGPVAIGAVIWKKDFYKNITKGDRNALLEIKNKDSKKLSPEQREVWFEKIKVWKEAGELDFHVALISNTIIDSKGISFAIKKGIQECLNKILSTSNINPDTCLVLLDGSLKAPAEFLYQKTIIKGDEKEQVISLASIAAKVTRDKKMLELAKKYPNYSLEIHKGYGTTLHRNSLKKYGLSMVHRRSFCRNIMAVSPKPAS